MPILWAAGIGVVVYALVRLSGAWSAEDRKINGDTLTDRHRYPRR